MDNLTTVSYEQGRDLIRDGDLIFVANKKGIILPALVRWSTKSIFSHVAIAFWIETAGVRRLMAVQAQGGNKRFVMNVSALDKCDLYVVAGPKFWSNIAPIAMAKLDVVPYGWFEAVYVGFREFLMTRFNIIIKEREFTGEICSEFNARVEGFPDVLVSPQGLFEEATKLNPVRVILSN